MNDTTVFIVDDDPGMRDSLSVLLSLRGFRTQVFANAETFLEVYRPDWRGCLLTDLRMPGLSGLDLHARLRERRIELPVVVLTAHGDVATTRRALKEGAFDFLEKPVDDEMLVDVLNNAIRADHARRDSQKRSSESLQRLARLTPRERDVLDLLAEGCSNRDVAARLELSPRTVEAYKARMMEKLQCRTLAEAIRLHIDAAAST